MAWGALLFALLVATGAGYRLAYERHVRSSRKHDPDRLIWLAYAAALFLAFFAWPIYEIYDQISPLETGEENPTNRHPSWWVWGTIPGLAVITWIVGHLSGRARSRSLANQSEAHMKERNESYTGFDFVMYAPLMHASLKDVPDTSRDTLLMIQLKPNNGQEYIVIGHPRYAAASPHPLDIYLKPVFFHGTKELLAARAGGDTPYLERQGHGVLVRYEDVLFTIVLISEEEESNA